MNFTNFWSGNRRTFYPTQISGCVFWIKSSEGNNIITQGSNPFINSFSDLSGLNNNISSNNVNGAALPYYTSSQFPLTGANTGSNWRAIPRYGLNTQSIPNFFSASMTNSMAAPTGMTFVMIGQRIANGSENRMHIDSQGGQGLTGSTFIYPSHKLSLLSGGEKQSLLIESSFTYSSSSASIVIISRSIPINLNAPLVVAYSYNQTTRDVNFWVNGGSTPVQFRVTASVNPMSNSFRHIMTTDTGFVEAEAIKYNRVLTVAELNQIQDYAIANYGMQGITTPVTESWSPLQLPGLKAWFDAKHVGYNTSNQIQSWYDLAGEGFDSIANDTVFKPEFETSNSFFTNAVLIRDGRKLTSSLTPTGSGATELLIATVYNMTAVPASTLAGFFSCGNLQNSFALYLQRLQVNGTGAATSAIYSWSLPPVNTKQYSIFTISLGQIETRRPRHIRNGVDINLTQLQNNTTNSTGIGNVKYTIGGQSPGTNANNMSGSIAELIYLTGSSPFSNQVIADIQSYFTNKYGSF